jgi:hypothetical protein
VLAEGVAAAAAGPVSANPAAEPPNASVTAAAKANSLIRMDASRCVGMRADVLDTEPALRRLSGMSPRAKHPSSTPHAAFT